MGGGMQSATVNPSSVWFFSTVHFHVSLYIAYIKGSIVAQVALVRLYTGQQLDVRRRAVYNSQSKFHPPLDFVSLTPLLLKAKMQQHKKNPEYFHYLLFAVVKT